LWWCDKGISRTTSQARAAGALGYLNAHECAQIRTLHINVERFEMTDDYLDRPLLGVEQIGRVARFVDERGRVDKPKTRRALALGYLDGDKFGKMWASTPRRVLRSFTGGAK
jgi:hypothetical protein